MLEISYSQINTFARFKLKLLSHMVGPHEVERPDGGVAIGALKSSLDPLNFFHVIFVFFELFLLYFLP